MTLVMARVKDGHLVPLGDAEKIQTEHERTRCIALLREAANHLEMYARFDLALEVRGILTRLDG
jgi:hypothetical protein